MMRQGVSPFSGSRTATADLPCAEHAVQARMKTRATSISKPLAQRRILATMQDRRSSGTNCTPLLSSAVKRVHRAANKPARLQHQPSGVQFFIVEPNLQTGSAVAHVIDVLPPAAALSRVAAGDSSQTWQYRCVASV